MTRDSSQPATLEQTKETEKIANAESILRVELDGPGPQPHRESEGNMPRVSQARRFELATDAPESFPAGLKYTDSDNSERLVHLHRDRIRYVPNWKKWVVWNGVKWQIDPDGVLVTELAKDVSKQLFRELADMTVSLEVANLLKERSKWATQAANRGRLDAMVKLARGMEGIVTPHEFFDTDHWAFGVGNGWIDLHDGTFHDPDPAKLMMHHTDVCWNEGAEASTWERALEQWLPDEDARRYFQRLVGEAAVGTVRDHVLVLMYGGGANGKSTAIGTLSLVFGPYFVIPHKSLLMATKHDQHQTETAELFGKRLAVAAETPRGSKLNAARIKELTGGDQLQARRLYEDPWKFNPTHSLWLQTNELPNVEDMGTGMWRRVRVLEWPAEFTGDKMNTELKEELEAEVEGVLKWIVDGAAMWNKEGLNEPASVKAAIASYEASQDLIEQFFEAVGITTAKGLTTSGGAITDAWRTWSAETFGRTLSGQELKKRLEDHGYVHLPGRNSRWAGFGAPKAENRGTHAN